MADTLTTAQVRPLRQGELSDALTLLKRTPTASALVTSRIYELGLSEQRVGPELLGYFRGGQLLSLCHVGANVVPVATNLDALRAFAERLAERPAQCASVVGRSEEVLPFWDLLSPWWGNAREVRPRQPLMEVFGLPLVAPDPRVRPVAPHEIDIFLPAAVDMFTEEVGTSPLAGDGGRTYRGRVAQLIAQQRAYAWIEDDRVVFKAEIGAVSPEVCLVQGVYVRPDRRGEGLSPPAMAAVVRAARRHHAPMVALYVNDYNERARALYRRVGFVDVGMFATVILDAPTMGRGHV